MITCNDYSASFLLQADEDPYDYDCSMSSAGPNCVSGIDSTGFGIRFRCRFVYRPCCLLTYNNSFVFHRTVARVTSGAGNPRRTFERDRISDILPLTSCSAIQPSQPARSPPRLRRPCPAWRRNIMP